MVSGSPSRVTRLFRDQLTGVIPAALGQLSMLSHLLLSYNQLTGQIPGELGQLSQLGRLYLNNNQLTGEIPAALGQLSLLEKLHLQHNQLTGEIPPELGQLSKLEEFSFRGNLLMGPVPSGLNHLPNVHVLNLTATRSGSDRIEVSWDDPGDPAAGYEYRLRDEAEAWTDWASIGDQAAMLRMGEGVTIEWTLTGLSYPGIAQDEGFQELDSGKRDSRQYQPRIRKGDEDLGQQPIHYLRRGQRRRQAWRTEWRRCLPAQSGVAVRPF